MDILDDVPSYHDFLHSYLLPNKPVIIGPALVHSWPALQTWVTSRGTINWNNLKTAYGMCEVTVADCSTRDSSERREKMHFCDVVSLWQAGEGRAFYVKDWHLARSLATHPVTPSQPFYTTPDIFRDDWMNAYYSACTDDDFRFVYVGAAGTFTPLHRDVYTSYSWSSNVCGRKRWWLFPPDQTPLLFRRGGEEHLETAYDVRDVDSEAFPLFGQASPTVVEQEPGQTIFVPSGWYHQVENITDCISINHNWCNSVNITSLYNSMCDKVAEVEHALEDVKELLSSSNHRASAGTSPETGQTQSWEREWIAIVQDVVEKDAGWNWSTFWRMIQHALSLAMERPCTVVELLWPRTPRELMPALDMTKSRILVCYKDFIQRGQRELYHVPMLSGVLEEVQALLNDGRRGSTPLPESV